MVINTLIIGHEPLKSNEGKKPREIKHDTYFKELLAQYDLGTVHFASQNNWQGKVDEIHPLFIVSLMGDYNAREVKEYAKDSFLYVGRAQEVFLPEKTNLKRKR